MLFVDAALGKTTEKPVWMMRQAGRYLPEYRELRNRFPDFISFMHNVDAAAEATLQPTRRFDIDAAILFSDILVALPHMGFDLKFEAGKGPVVSNPFRTAADFKNLKDVDLDRNLECTKLALQKVRRELSQEKALLGFVGGPLTIASYTIEDSNSKDLHSSKALYYREPEVYAAFLSKMAETTGRYLAKQAEWGADALVIMDSWAGRMDRTDYEAMSKPYVEKVIEIVRKQTDVPIVYYANGAPHLESSVVTLNANVIGLDHRSDLSKVFAENPQKIFQGNLDQAVLFAPPEMIRERTQGILKLAENRPHIMNLGHGVLPDTPLEGVKVFVDTVHGFVSRD